MSGSWIVVQKQDQFKRKNKQTKNHLIGPSPRSPIRAWLPVETPGKNLQRKNLTESLHYSQRTQRGYEHTPKEHNKELNEKEVSLFPKYENRIQ